MGTGSVVAFLHDITDIFGCLCKLFNCTIYQTTCVFFFFVNLGTWFYTRILCLPFMLYYFY